MCILGENVIMHGQVLCITYVLQILLKFMSGRYGPMMGVYA